jgi:hypothetical protein
MALPSSVTASEDQIVQVVSITMFIPTGVQYAKQLIDQRVVFL